MPRKNINAIVLLKNTFAKEYIYTILAKQNIKVLASPNTTSQTLLLLEQQKPDLFICEDDFETTEIILPKHLKINSSLKTILFINKSSVDEILEYYKLGVLSVLNIASPHFELAESIRSVLKGNTYISAVYRRFIKREQIDTNGVLKLLTVREKEIMNLIAKGYTNVQLAEILKLSPNSVNNHRGNIRKKLKLNGGKSQLLQIAIELERESYEKNINLL